VDTELDRRAFIAWFSTASLAAFLAPKALARGGDDLSINAIADGAKLAGLDFTREERRLMDKTVNEHLASYRKLREVPLDNGVPPALRFHPLVPPAGGKGDGASFKPTRDGDGPALAGEDLGFLSVTELASRVRTRRMSSVELTRFYLERLHRLDPTLLCVITFTDGLAMEQARKADQEIGAGRWRGPLHGIPWGVKDLFAARGYPTTWGAKPFEDQVIDEDAAVVSRLAGAGAVLTAKLSVGALAWGDVWFGGMTRNPWKTDQGSSGSSAGVASAAAAGLIGFGVGTETLGSIVSPSQRCGATGLRPTFGRVSRHGCMALSWSMDKAGPIARSVEDCALVLDAIRGADDRDPCSVDAPFPWDSGRDPRTVRLGFDEAAFAEKSDDAAFDQAALDVLRTMGFDLKPVTLPDLPISDMLFILEAEASAAFDDLVREHRERLMVRQVEDAWPNVFRAARLVPAVEYIRANRARTILMKHFEDALEGVDAYVHPTFGGSTLLAANLTGHPTVVMPNGFREDGTPTSISFTGRLWGEADLLLVAKAYQDETGFHRRHPTLG
jgi:Asp-tRNA(Asn)/Glu-tRNA(Gln) amidotransferase A subunit family amidase